jgi:hypothetical protein
MQINKSENTFFHHLIALFCTVPANPLQANSFATIFSNEIKDLELVSKQFLKQNRSKLST